MADDAHLLGTLDALCQLGLEKTALAAALLPLGGAALGAALAPDGERLQGAGLGAMGGFLAHGGLKAISGVKPHVGGPTQVVPPATGPAVMSTPVEGVPPNVKSADFSLGVNIPHTPLNIGFKSREDRLPGMKRWVPRDVIERAYEGADQGLDDQALLEEAFHHGEFSSPGLGAIGGALVASHYLPNSGSAGKAIGGLLGASLGSIYHVARAPKQVEDMRQALVGVANNPASSFPIQGRSQATAAEPQPIVVSRSGTE